MESLFTQSVSCPYCGETFDTVIDTSQGECEYTEDCYVCCRPILLTLQWTEHDTVTVDTRREDD